MAASPASFERLLSAELARDIEFLNARARAIGSSIANDHLSRFDLRVRSYSVLALACGGIGPTQRDLAEFLRLDPSQIVAIVDELEASGLVRRVPDPSDRRSKVIEASAAGERLYIEASLAVRQAEDEALAALDEAERAELRRLLRKVAFSAGTRAAP